MKKLVLFASLLLVMLGVLTLPAAAQDESHSLAQYFPATSPFYLEFRTDDEFLTSLDALVAKIGEMVPDANIDGSLMDMIDDAVRDLDPDGSFATTIRPWLGDDAAFGLYEYDEEAMNSDEQPFLLVISIADQAAAEEFLTTYAPNDYSESEEDGYTLYTPEDDANGEEPSFIFRDDVVIITASADIIEAGGVVEDGLNGSDAFNTAANMLPESGYDVFGYMDTPTFFNTTMTRSMGMEEMEMFGALFNAIEPQAFGLTQLNDLALALDFASPLNLDADSPFAVNATEPIDPTFAEHIPAESVLVVQGTNLYQSYQTGIESLNAMAEMMKDNPDFNPQDLRTALFALEFGVRGLTGLEIDEAIGWMTGDYAFAVGLAPAFADANNVMAAMQDLPVDFGIVVEATDADAAQQLYDGLSEALDGMSAEELDVTEETLDGDISALVVTISSPDMPYPIELLASTGNGVFAVGTRRMVTAAINPQNGLNNDENFAAAAETVLDNANALLYVGANSLQPLARVMSNPSNTESVQDSGIQLKAILGLFRSVTISSSVEADNSGGVTRFVWTLPE